MFWQYSYVTKQNNLVKIFICNCFDSFCVCHNNSSDFTQWQHQNLKNSTLSTVLYIATHRWYIAGVELKEYRYFQWNLYQRNASIEVGILYLKNVTCIRGNLHTKIKLLLKTKRKTQLFLKTHCCLWSLLIKNHLVTKYYVLL